MNRYFYKLTRLAIFIIITCVSSSCNQKEYKAMKIIHYWKGKEIIIPDSIKFKKHGIYPIDLYRQESDCKILVYVDSIGCTSCKMKLEEWNKMISHFDSISNYKVEYLFVIHNKNPKELSYVLINDNFEIPVFVDTNDILNKINKFPQDILYQTFLLNSKNEVLFVGNPVYNDAVKELYDDFLTK